MLLCGHYEGIDERIMREVDEEVSIGDYVLTGGELPAMILLDAVARFVPGVLGDAHSAEEESFSNGLLEYPQYTRPEDYEGERVPEVLLSGHHQNIENWRQQQSLLRTMLKRPEKLLTHTFTPEEQVLFCEALFGGVPEGKKKRRKRRVADTKKAKVYIGLLHYPMVNRRGDEIATSVTNLDIHDIARTARTYGVDRFFIVHPSEKQRALVERIADYWENGFGGVYNADRSEALSRLAVCTDLPEVLAKIEAESGQKPLVVATDAKIYPETVPYQTLRQRIMQEEELSVLVLFGTGWGMTEALKQQCDQILPPIALYSDYNHLSVRAAAAIIVDRLLGENWFR